MDYGKNMAVSIGGKMMEALQKKKQLFLFDKHDSTVALDSE